MLNHSVLRFVAMRFPRLFRGRRLHRMALAASHAGRAREAERLFEVAVARYRSELRIEPLARLRAHELMTQVRSGQRPENEVGLSLEIERRLSCLETIEQLEPPFARVEARSMLANWQGMGAAEPEEIKRAA